MFKSIIAITALSLATPNSMIAMNNANNRWSWEECVGFTIGVAAGTYAACKLNLHLMENKKKVLAQQEELKVTQKKLDTAQEELRAKQEKLNATQEENKKLCTEIKNMHLEVAQLRSKL